MAQIHALIKTLKNSISNKTGRAEQQNKRQQNQAVDDGGQDHLSITIINFENGILDGDLVAQVNKGVKEDN